MAINTLITIRDAIQAFVDGHGQLQAVRFGADDKRAPYLTEQELFPVLYVAPIDVEVGRAHNTHRLRVYVYERLNDADQDEWENANDTSLILRDIRVWWNDYGVDDILIETDPTGTFKTDSELDNLVGYYAEILFQIPSHGRCDVPVSIEPVPPPTCEDASYIVEYADGTPIESGTIPSGGSVTIVVPNCPPAGDVVWTLFDTDGNVLDSGTEPAGGTLTIVAPDATFDINGVQVATIPSGGSDSIQVRRASGSTQVGALQGQHWRVANTTVQLRDSANNNIGSVNSYGAESSNNLTAPDGTVTVNRDGVFFATQAVRSGGTASVDVDVPFWQRNPDWLPLPEVNVGDNRFVGLYAVFEDDADGNTITIGTGIGNQIDYGDGTIITSIAGTNTHQYDYATISSPILQMEDGTNYKMVVVDCDITGTLHWTLNQNITGRSNRVTGWLDIVAAGSSLTGVRVSDNTAGMGGFAMFLERLLILEMNTSGTPLTTELLNSLPRIKVFEYPMLDVLTNFTRLFTRSGDIRNSQGQPISINNTAFTGSLIATFNNSSITKLGDIILPNATGTVQTFTFSKIKEVGNIDLSSVNALQAFFTNTGLQKVGTITVGTNLTNIQQFIPFIYNLRRLVFAGDMSSVTNTTNAFQSAWGLQELILPNLTVGFDIRWSAVSGQELQDLFTSLGTASGAQTITLPNFTIGEPTTIATGKGYTIAYA
jgi:hypothetical protein